jgi:transposase-like protein
VLTVGNDAARVERQLSEGGLTCPQCAARLRKWGYGRVRVIRLAGGAGWRLRPRRAICAGCGQTHVLLPAGVLARRADAAGVIGVALTGAAAGLGHRTIAAQLGRAASTVRGWLRRFALRAEPLRSAFTVLACVLDADPLLPGPAGSPLADAVVAIVAACAAAGRRWGALESAVSPWDLASAVTSGRLLCPGAAVQMINTSCPW